MTKLFTVLLALVLVGGGCSYKYESDWNTQDRAWENQPATSSEEVAVDLNGDDMIGPGEPGYICLSEGQSPAGDVFCCEGLEPIPVDDDHSVCGKSGTGHKPRVCAAPDEVLTAETPNCCAGLEPTEKNNKWVCDYQK